MSKMSHIKDVSVNLSPLGEPRPTVMPEWSVGDQHTFIAADFRADGHGNFKIVAVFEQWGRTDDFRVIECAPEDAEGYAADLMSDAEGYIMDRVPNYWTRGDLAASVADLASKVARQVAA